MTDDENAGDFMARWSKYGLEAKHEAGQEADAARLGLKFLPPRPMDALPVSPDRSFLFIHGFINSALYIVGVFIVGLVWNHHPAVILSVATAALCYLAAFVQLTWPPRDSASTILSGTIVVASIIVGAFAGLSLLW